MSEPAALQPTSAQITDLTTAEMIQLLGWQETRLRRWLAHSLFRPGVAHFARHVLRYENWIGEAGWGQANRLAAGQYLRSLSVFGAQQLPAGGPLLFTANHPGITDFMAISAAAGRDDLSILAYTRPFLQSLPDLSSHILHLEHDPDLHFQTLRRLIRHLRSGHAVLTFPAGMGEPDPAVMPGAVGSLERWQPSVELLVRRVPDLKVVPTLVSGVLSRRALDLSFVRRLPTARRKIRVAGTLQVMWQTITGRPVSDVRVDFGAPLAAADFLQPSAGESILEALKERLRGLIIALPQAAASQSAFGETALVAPPQKQSLS